MKGKKVILSCSLAILSVTSIATAQEALPKDNGLFSYHTSPRWRESESHPIRIAAYIIHPVGWTLREGVFRPLSYLIGSTRTTRSVFGFREPTDFREPFCFDGSDQIPDCRKISPFGNVMPAEAEEAVAPAPAEQVVFPDIAFDFDKSTLNELGRGRVRQVAKLLQTVPSIKVVVEGHTDFKGSEDYNTKLGQRRAETVIKELTEMGIDAARMTPVSFGESRPVFTEQEDWARAVNRRVQFSVGTPAAEPAAAPAPGAAS